jgi:WD40 repeat protein
MPADPTRARDLFLHAVGKLPPEEWDPYVARASCGDAELFREVTDMLRGHLEAGSFLARPAVALTGAFGSPTQTAVLSGVAAGVTVAGRYKLLERIGEGGMGDVWLAEQQEPVRRKVAIKLIKPGMDSDAVLARFEAERQALALMDHPNIAKVLDGGATDGGRPFFVMELVKGTPITRYCDDHKLGVRDRLSLFADVCRAVQHAHQKGVIHRDLKPSNVLVAPYDGRPVVKVIDFGVAKAAGQPLTEKTLFTAFGALVGTPEYMSPEQAELNNADIDTRSDVYSLGVLLYELLTGTTPLTVQRVRAAALLEVLRLVREEDPPKPSTRLSTADGLPAIAANRGLEPRKLSGQVRGELDWIVMRALEKDRNRRYESANGLADDVVHFLNDEPVRACPASTGYRVRRFCRRNKRLLATATVLVISLVLGISLSAWQAVRATHAERLAQTRLQSATEAQDATRAQLTLTQLAEDDARRRLYRALVAQAQASRLSRRMGQRFKTLDILNEAIQMAREMNLGEADFLELRNEAIACLALADMRVSREWDGCPTGTMRVEFAANLERYACADWQGGVTVCRVSDGTVICRIPAIEPGESSLKLSPDGRFLARNHGRQFELWSFAGREPVRMLIEPPGSFAFSTDSRLLARDLADHAVSVYDLAEGREIKKLDPGPSPTGGMSFHPTGRQLAIGHASGVQIRDVETGRVAAELPQPTNWSGFGRIAWHPQGRTLAVAGPDRIIHIWDLDTLTETARLQGHANDGIECAFNHAGTLVVSGSWDRTLRIWDPQTGQQLVKETEWSHDPLFSPDDRLLAAGLNGPKIKLWEVVSPTGNRTLDRHPGRGKVDVFQSAVHPDGRLLAAAMPDGVHLWDLKDGKYLASLRSSPTYGVLFEPEPSGALLTNAPEGLYRWPVRADRTAPDSLHIGPPERLSAPGSDCNLACSGDGCVIANPQRHRGAVVLHKDRPDQVVALGPHADVRCVSVSRDGRLVGTGSHSAPKVKIWDAATGELVKELPVESGSGLTFSPDGKWLATTAVGGRLWSVDGWQFRRDLGGEALAFSPNGGLLVVETGHGAVRMVDPGSGREYARLEDPNQHRSTISFTPDGGRLVMNINESESIRVCDLRAIWAELAKMGLDNGLPGFKPRREALRPLQVQVDGVDGKSPGPKTDGQ